LRYDKRSDEWAFASNHPLLTNPTIHDIGVDEDFTWIANDKGIASSPLGSVEWRFYTSSDGLPDDSVVSFDFHSDYVWAGTAKGIARFDKYIEEWESIQVPELSSGMTDIAVWGDNIWIVSPLGIFSVDIENTEVQKYSVEDNILEIVIAGGNIWFLGERIAQRYVPAENIWRRYGTEQGFPQNPTDVKVEGKTIWISSPGGIHFFNAKLDRWTEFLPLRSSPVGVEVKSVAPDGGYLWVLTPRGVGRYDETTGAWRRFSELDGLMVKEGLSITADGNYIFVVGTENVGVYYKSRDSWRTYGYDSIGISTGKTGRKLIAIEPSGLTLTPSDSTKFSISGISSLGFKLEPEIKSQDFWNSLSLHGELPSQRSISGIYDDVIEEEKRYKLEYQGTQNDIVREITVGEAQFRPFNSSLLDKEEVAGIGTKLSKGSTRSELWFSQRRGIPYVDFLRGQMGAREIFSLSLSHKDIIPYSEKLFVDGSLMQRNVHYFIAYTQGRIVFSEPDLVDPDSRIRVEYQYRESSTEGRFSSIQLETKQMNDKAKFGAIFTDLPGKSNRYIATSGFAQWKNEWFLIQPEIAYANPDTHLAEGCRLELNSEKVEIKALLRHFTPDFPSTINRLTEFGKLTDEVDLETSIRPWNASSFKFHFNSGKSQIGNGNFARANFKFNPKGLPSLMLSGRYDVLDTSAERDKRVGGKIGIGYDLPEGFLKKLRLSELGFSSRLGSTYLDLGEKKTGFSEENIRYDTYWKIYAGIKAGASANIYQRFSRLADYTVRRTILGMQIIAIPGINSSLYFDLFKSEDKSNPIAVEENLLSANLSVFPGNWSPLLEWLDILSGYTVIGRAESSRVHSILIRPTIRFSQRMRFLANWITTMESESKETRLDSELLYTPDFGRIGLNLFARPSKGNEELEKGLVPWCEFRILGIMNGLRLSLVQTPKGKLTMSPEHRIRHHMRMKKVLRSIYLANSVSITTGEVNRISESPLVELSTNFSLTFRFSGTLAYDLNRNESNVNFLFRGYAKF